MLLIPNQFKFRPSNNIKYLERILDISIMEAIQADIDTYLSKMSSGIIRNKGVENSFAITTKESRNIFTILLNYNKNTTKLLQLKDGLPYINNELILGNVKSMSKKINTDKLLMDIDGFANLSKLCSEVQRKINKLVSQDMDILDIKDKYFSTNLNSWEELITNKEFSKATIIRTKSRVRTLLYYQRTQNSSYTDKFTLLDLIRYDIDKYKLSINKSIKFWFFVELRQIFLPKYQSSLLELAPRLKLAGKMKLPEYYIKHLVKLPKTNFSQLSEVLIKYQMGYFLIERYKELKAFDINKLIAKNAHPKEIKDLIVKFYTENSIFKLTEKIITKILRYNIRLFSHAETTLNQASENEFLSPEHFLMAIFSDMPQICLLTNPRTNRLEIAAYINSFMDTFKFCSKFKNRSCAIEMTKAILRKNLHTNSNYKIALTNAKVELIRLFDNFTNHELIINGLSQVKIWSIKKLVALHDNIGMIINLYYTDRTNARTEPELLKHIESKILEPIIINKYKFTQLTTYNELQNEGKNMNHCVLDYFRSNYYDGLFIFNVTPLEESQNKDIYNYSTLAIYINDEGRFRINQNFTQHNEEPSVENENIVPKFINHLQATHLSLFTDYIKTSNKYRKKITLNYDIALDENIYINKLINGVL